jgi:hypothetical protein
MTTAAWTRRQDNDEQPSAADSECACSDDQRVGWASSRCGSSVHSVLVTPSCGGCEAKQGWQCVRCWRQGSRQCEAKQDGAREKLLGLSVVPRTLARRLRATHEKRAALQHGEQGELSARKHKKHNCGVRQRKNRERTPSSLSR